MEFPKEMMHDSVWFDRTKYQQDREHYELFLTNNLSCQLAEKHAGQSTKVAAQSKSSSALTSEIAKARESIKQSLATSAAPPPPSQLEMENLELKKTIDELVQRLNALESRVTTLEGGKAAPVPAVKQEVKPAAKEESSDEDLFGSDSESEDEAEKQKKADRVAAYQAKKATKKVVIAKSMVIFDVKPWEDTTDLKAMEGLIRKIEMDGLIWGQQAKTVPIAYGIKKLQISAVVEDLKVSTDELSEKICDLEDYVQSVDIAAFNKL